MHCTRAQAEAIAELELTAPNPPVLVADEPDESRPDKWLIHAYFDHEPTAEELAEVARLGSGEPRTEALGEADWVTMSQAGLQPIRAGRFFIHTPTHRGSIPAGTTAFEIDAGLAFGTGQHATTAGCLEQLDILANNGCEFTNIADVGTGTGLLAFAALSLWPRRPLHCDRHRPAGDPRRARQCRDQRCRARPRRGRASAGGRRRDGFARCSPPARRST